MIREALAAVVDGKDLSEDEAGQVMREIAGGEATPAQIGAFLIALRMKGETVDEIVGMMRVMREKALPVEVGGDLLDTCGTGGDGSGTFNVSTAAAFVCVGAGVRVAKHGNRAASSASGSADVLEALGAKIELTPEQVRECIDTTGMGFMFAQAFHPAMRVVGPVRRELGVRTIFNILGPLTNPARPQRQLFGVGDAGIAPEVAAVLGRMGTKRALVVHGDDGLDEVSLSGPTRVSELRDGRVVDYALRPEDAGLSAAPLEVLKGGSPEENAERIRRIFGGEMGPGRDFVLINAGAALVAAERAATLREGVGLAATSIDLGAAQRTLEAFIEITRGFGSAT